MEKMSDGLKWQVYGCDSGLDTSLQKNWMKIYLDLLLQH